MTLIAEKKITMWNWHCHNYQSSPPDWKLKIWRGALFFQGFKLNPAVCPQHGPALDSLQNTDEFLNEIKQLLQSWNQTSFMYYDIYLFSKQTIVNIETSPFSQNFLADSPSESLCMRFIVSQGAAVSKANSRRTLWADPMQRFSCSRGENLMFATS